jgi:ribonuclease PH
MRHDGRADDQPRPLVMERNWGTAAQGSVLVRSGRTTVLCTASVSNDVPPWMAGKGRGWVTAEYNMLPGSTSPRKARPAAKPDGRSTEIQRLIGRSLRAGIDLLLLGERSVTIDCDVLLADGGTRTASISGGWVALADALGALRDADGAPVFPRGRSPLTTSIAAVSVGLVEGRPVLDLDYREDSRAQVDLNAVMTGDGRFVEVQGGGEGFAFERRQLDALVSLAEGGATGVLAIQRAALGDDWPLK